MVQDFGLNIQDFPDLKATLLSNTVKFYFYTRYVQKRPNEEDFMDLSQIEDLFVGNEQLECLFIEEMMNKKMYCQAKGLMMRHNLKEKVKQWVIDELNDPEIKGTDERNPDKFGPISG